MVVEVFTMDSSRFGRTFEAACEGGRTCVGVLRTDYPLESGNCFDVLDGNGRSFRIVNFVAENLDEAIARGVVAWPMRCVVLREPESGAAGVAAVHDARLPVDWYCREWCEVCCPLALLPVPQQMATALRRESGEETVTGSEGVTVVSRTIRAESRVLMAPWIPTQGNGP